MTRHFQLDDKPVTDNSNANRDLTGGLYFHGKEDLGFGDFDLGHFLKLKTRNQLLAAPWRHSGFGGSVVTHSTDSRESIAICCFSYSGILMLKNVPKSFPSIFIFTVPSLPPAL